MTDLNVNSIDFSTLDIDKYLNWLKSEYKKFSIVHTLPSLEKKKLEYLYKDFKEHSNYILENGVLAPMNEKAPFKDVITSLDEQIKTLKDLPPRLIFFNCVEYDKDMEGKTYAFFTSKELEQIYISGVFLDQCQKMLKDWREMFLEQLKEGFEGSPLPKKEYYTRELYKLKTGGFKYWEQIINNDFVYNLNEFSTCLGFFMDISRIYEAKYLATRIKELDTLPTKPKKSLSLNPNFDDPKGQIAVIYEQSKELFTSTVDQWQNLFSNDIQPFTVPIELKDGITISDLRLFMDTLKNKGLIKNSKFNTLLETVRAFSNNGTPLKSRQYAEPTQSTMYPNTKNKDKIDKIFEALKLE